MTLQNSDYNFQNSYFYYFPSHTFLGKGCFLGSTEIKLISGFAEVERFISFLNLTRFGRAFETSVLGQCALFRLSDRHCALCSNSFPSLAFRAGSPAVSCNLMSASLNREFRGGGCLHLASVCHSHLEPRKPSVMMMGLGKGGSGQRSEGRREHLW